MERPHTRFLPHDHALSDLQTQAALTSGWPTLHADLPADRADAFAARVESVLGPLPQGELIDRGEGAVELRVDLPGLDAPLWGLADAALRDAGLLVALAPGLPRGAREARDLGLVDVEWLGDGALLAAAPFHPDSALPAAPDLALRPPDTALAGLEHDLALAAADAGVMIETERGPDTVDAAVHRTTGRLGLRLAAAPGADVDLDRLLRALADVIRAHAADPTTRLAPDLLVERHLGTAVVLWLIAPPAAGLPHDQPVPAGVWLPPHPHPGDCELQLVPVDLSTHDDAVAAALPHAARLELLGGPPRWVHTPAGLSFAPTWRGPAAAGARFAAAVVDHPAVHAVRVVPRFPGDAPHAGTLDPMWRQTPAGRSTLRLRDGATDRDWAPALSERHRDDADDALIERLRGFGGSARPVAIDGLPAMALRDLPAASTSPASLDALWSALDHRVPVHQWPTALMVGRPKGDAVLLLRAADPVPAR